MTRTQHNAMKQWQAFLQAPPVPQYAEQDEINALCLAQHIVKVEALIAGRWVKTWTCGRSGDLWLCEDGYGTAVRRLTT